MSSDSDKRRGIDKTAAKLRESAIKNGNPDPGFDACRDRVRRAVDLKDKQRNQQG